MRTVIALALPLLVVLNVIGTTTARAVEHPNVIVILTDDQGWGDLSINGNQNLATTNLDQLARDGARFSHFYVCPVCSPTRAEFLTGRYHTRLGVTSTSSGGERLKLDETTIADVFQAAGYKTAAFGKWHNGTQYPYHPLGRGFDHCYGFTSGHWGHYYSPMLDRDGAITRGTGYLTDDFTNEAIAFIKQNQEKPFFAYLAYNTPHSPMQVPDRWWKKHQDKPFVKQVGGNDSGHTRAALAMCENIDWNVGRLLASVEELGLSKNTIIVFFCDNGPNGPRYNGGLRGRKGSTDEGGVRSPLFIRWPDNITRNQVIEPISGAIDLLPTLAELAGIQAKPKHPLDGRSLAPQLLGDDKVADERLIFSHWKGKVSVRSQRFRLDARDRLYDMQVDSGQTKDVAAEHPQITKQLQAARNAWTRDTKSSSAENWPYLIGHPGMPLTQLPARDATFSGGIQRSNRFPNCSFLTHWKKPADAIIWDVEVAAAGRYEIELHYTCPADQTGATVELSLGKANTRGQVTAAHESPLIGTAQDRVKRIESYSKQFKSMSLGMIELPVGQGTLKLQAIEVPNGNVMDFRLLTLRRVKID